MPKLKMEEVLGKLARKDNGKGRIYHEFTVVGLDAPKLNFEGDSHDYEILWDTAQEIKGIPGMVLEIGVRRGLGIFTMINSCVANKDIDRKFLGIDCYGGWAADYTNDMKQDAKRALTEFCWHAKVDFTLMELEDSEFFKRYADGVPVYKRVFWETKTYKPQDYEWKRVINDYALVHLDGPHSQEEVTIETEFFLARIPKGGIIVYDDITRLRKYDHSKIEPLLFAAGFEIFQKTASKGAYIRR